MSHKMWVWAAMGLLAITVILQDIAIRGLEEQAQQWRGAVARWEKEIERIDTEVRALNGLKPLDVTVLDDGGAHLTVESHVVPVK